MPNFVMGGVARNDDFLFREEFVLNLWETLKTQNVLLLAPRRTGKTSVMYCLMDEPDPDWTTVHLNAEVLEDPAEFFLSLISACHEQTPDFFHKALAAGWAWLGGISNRIESVEGFEFKIELRKAEQWHKNWQQIATQLFERLAHSDQPVLIIIDELPDMLNALGAKSTEELRRFLHLLRDLRTSPKYDKVRWLVGGSVNIRGVLDEQNLISLVNDLHTVILPPFSADEVGDFVDQLFSERGVQYHPDVIDRILERLGAPTPYFLQLVTNELCVEWRQHQRQITPALVDQIIDHTLLGDVALDKFQHYHSRIRAHYPGPHREAAYRLLNELSRSTDGIRRSTLYAFFNETLASSAVVLSATEATTSFNNLLTRLASDFYVQNGADDRIDFNSKILKQWWLKYYGYTLK